MRPFEYVFSSHRLRIGLCCRPEPRFAITGLRLMLLRPGDRKLPASAPENRMLLRLANDVQAYLGGRLDVLPIGHLDLEALTPFKKKVLCELRRTVPRGMTISYGGLARAAGSPGASRAVGSVMSGNPFPLFFPCHRVVRGDGAVGWFQGGADGAELKAYLLELEGIAVVDGRLIASNNGRAQQPFTPLRRPAPRCSRIRRAFPRAGSGGRG